MMAIQTRSSRAFLHPTRTSRPNSVTGSWIVRWRWELAMYLLQAMLPGAAQESGEDRATDKQRVRLLTYGTEFYLRLKDQPEVAVTREMFEGGGSTQALELLCRQGSAEDYAAIA